MPIYEFACQDCGHEFEKIQSFSDSSTPACPNCQGAHVQRRLSPPAIHFKGSGWYVTDSKNAAKNPAVAKGSDAAKSETTSSSEPAASTPAASTPAASGSASTGTAAGE